MKTISLSIVSTLLFCSFAKGQYANQTLSNLAAPVAINRGLDPNATGTLDLGSTTKSWRNLYVKDAVYLSGNRFVGYGNNIFNAFVGNGAGKSNTTGTANVFVGGNAGFYNTTGLNNTAIGYFAMASNTTTYQNTAVGSMSLYSNVTGYYNTAIGYKALFTGINSWYNTAVGTLALDKTESTRNTALGERAGCEFSNGEGNTFVGWLARASVGGLANSMALGQLSSVTASNQVRIGNTNVTSIGGYKAWSNLSDGRFKQNIKENVPGLSFINKLRPVTYNLDKAAMRNAFEGNSTEYMETGAPQMSDANRSIENISAEVSTGFVAQEVEKAAQEVGFAFDGVDAPKNEKDFYGLRYAEFVVPLVKSVQELSAENNMLKENLAQMQQQLDALKDMVIASKTNTSKVTVSNINLQAAMLEQNSPNPFNKTTAIKYTLPSLFSNASMVITNATGAKIQQIPLKTAGHGMVNINAGLLAAGAYYYQLVVDGQVADTKKMILAK